MAEEQDLTLAQLLSRALTSTTQITSAPLPNSPPIQSLLTTTLSDLTLAAKLIQHLAILSPNETLEDISTRDLRCLLVDALRGQLCVLVRTKGGEERLGWLRKAQVRFDIRFFLFFSRRGPREGLLLFPGWTRRIGLRTTSGRRRVLRADRRGWKTRRGKRECNSKGRKRFRKPPLVFSSPPQRLPPTPPSSPTPTNSPLLTGLLQILPQVDRTIRSDLLRPSCGPCGSEDGRDRSGKEEGGEDRAV